MAAFTVPDEQTITEAYIYLLGRMLVIRQERTDAAADGFGYNTVKFNPLGSADFVNPNFDVAYLEAWFAVDEATAMLLQVPEITGRYYTAQILDEWGEVIVNINERAAAVKPSGTFALVKPGSRPPLPAGATRVDLHSAKAKMLARVELKGDPDTAVRRQKEFSVTPLSQVTVRPPPVIPRRSMAAGTTSSISRPTACRTAWSSPTGRSSWSASPITVSCLTTSAATTSTPTPGWPRSEMAR